jgi:tetratricopeptide (TPR) repeat protein
MRVVLILTTIFFVIFQPPTPTTPSITIPEFWKNGCDDWAQLLIAPVAGKFDYDGACDRYLQCDPDDEDRLICQFAAARQLLESCTTEDLDCRRQALVLTAMIQGIDTSSFGLFSESIPRPEFLQRVRSGVVAFLAGDAETALADFDIPTELYVNHMIPFVRGVIHEQLGNDEQALQAYEEALYIIPTDPLVRYMRAPLYDRLGQPELAAFDAYWLGEFTADDPASNFVSQIVADYPLDLSQFETWIVYPIMELNGGVGGSFYLDQTAKDGIPVRLRNDDESDSILVLDLFQATAVIDTYYYGEGNVDAYRLVQVSNTPIRYALQREVGEYEFAAAYQLELTAVEESSELFTGINAIERFEQLGQQRFALVPEGTPDPRLAMREDACGVISRFEDGMTVKPAFAHEPPALYDQPNGDTNLNADGEISPFDELTVSGEGQCIESENGSVLWWPIVTENGLEAWIPENTSNDYVFNPVEETDRWIELE